MSESTTMSHLISRTSALIERFHSDEEGVNTLEIVMLLAVAAIVIAAIFVFWNQIWNWAKGLLDSTIKEGNSVDSRSTSGTE